jgi:hypothetical protein
VTDNTSKILAITQDFMREFPPHHLGETINVAIGHGAPSKNLNY